MGGNTLSDIKVKFHKKIIKATKTLNTAEDCFMKPFLKYSHHCLSCPEKKKKAPVIQWTYRNAQLLSIH